MTVRPSGSNRWFSLHVHSRKSRDDAMSPVKELVHRGAELGYPAIPLTDHGSVGGIVELYTESKKAGVLPMPGVELYVTPDSALGEQSSMHLTVLSRTAQGVRNLMALSTLAHQHFYYRPRVDFPTLAKLAEDGALQGLILATGCRSSPVVKALTERGPAAAEQVVKALAGWFPQTYVEVMDHGFKAEGMWDSEITDELLAIANRLGLPYVITTDTHYTHPEDQRLHNAYKELIGFSDDVAERRFHGEGYWLQSLEDLKAVYEPSVIEGALSSLDDIVNGCQVTIPELDTFSLKIPNVTQGENPFTALERRSARKLGERFGLDVPDGYDQRLTDELEVVKTSGMAPYLNLVIWITDWLTEQGIWFHTRGSATGSLILWLNGVTQEDPVAWDIRFDRFLSMDRTSPPDVDLDVEHTRRDDLFAMLAEHYTVLSVGTTMTYSLNGETDETGHLKGSLRQKYFSVANKGKSKDDPDYRASWNDAPTEERLLVEELSDLGLVSGRGKHPGGTVICSDPVMAAPLSLERIGKSGQGNMVTALDKDDVEKMGFPKIDILGSQVLTALHTACDLIVGGDGREYYESLDRKDKAAIKRAGSGKTVGLFQVSGWTQRRGFQEMKPKNLAEIVAGQAIYRPAPIDSGFTEQFLARRAKTAEIPTQHPDIMAETKATYGLAIYQEQLVGAMRRLGMESAQLTKMLKAVKASGKAGEEKAKQAVAEELESIRALATSKGWSQEDVDWLANTLVDYGAGYSFGKAHSVQYGVVAYKTCWLVEHEPLAFWTGMLLAYTGTRRKDRKGKEIDYEVIYAAAAREDGVHIVNAHVNRSDVGYVPDPENWAIRRGLTSIKDVGIKAATELVAKAPFTSLVDLGQRVNGDVGCAGKLIYGMDPAECGGVITPLYKAGALDGIPKGTPLRRPKGRIRRCQQCKQTFSTPLEYEDHVDGGHVLPELEEIS